MSNPLNKIEEYLDEAVRVFVSQGHSTKYEAPILYFLKELEAQAARNGSFSRSELESSLNIIQKKISSRLVHGMWK